MRKSDGKCSSLPEAKTKSLHLCSLDVTRGFSNLVIGTNESVSFIKNIIIVENTSFQIIIQHIFIGTIDKQLHQFDGRGTMAEEMKKHSRIMNYFFFFFWGCFRSNGRIFPPTRWIVRIYLKSFTLEIKHLRIQLLELLKHFRWVVYIVL